MTYGPIQMVVIGFDNADVAPEIAQELQAVRDEDIIRLIDLVFVSKDREGNIEGIEVTDFSWEEAVELGAIAGSLIGLGTGSSEAIEVGAEIGAQVADERYFGLTTEDLEEIAAQIPPGSSAAIADSVPKCVGDRFQLERDTKNWQDYAAFSAVCTAQIAA